MPTKTKNKKGIWSETFYVLVYQLALEGLSNSEIAKALQVSDNLLTRWSLDKPGLGHALSEGRMQFERQTKGRLTTLQDHIFGKLTPQLRRMWKELNEIEREPNAVHRIQKFFEKNGETTRKRLFLHALSRTHFNPSRACQKLCISKRDLDKWIEEDLEFAQLLVEFEFHKDSFFEGKLVELVERGNPQAIMMVNRTRNRTKGYGESVEVQHSGKIEHQSTFDITMLSSKLQQAILSELREQEEANKKGQFLLEEQE